MRCKVVISLSATFTIIEMKYYKLQDGKMGSLRLEKIPYLLREKKNLLLDQGPVHAISFRKSQTILDKTGGESYRYIKIDEVR